MSKSMKRSIKTGQVGLRQLVVTFNGTTDVVSGFDQFGIKEVIDLGAGLHTLVLANPFERNCLVTGFAVHTPDATIEIVSSTFDRVTIQSSVSGAPADAKYTVHIIGSDSRYDH